MLGKIQIDTDVEGSLGLRVNAKQAEARARASFEFLGKTVTIGRFKVDVTAGSFAKLGKGAEMLGKDLGKGAEAIGKGAQDVGKDFGKGVKNVGKGLGNFGKKLGKLF